MMPTDKLLHLLAGTAIAAVGKEIYASTRRGNVELKEDGSCLYILDQSHDC